MNKLKNNFGQDDENRTLLKNLHKKVYSICRLFTHNYAAHQSLFTNTIAAAAQSLNRNKYGEDKQTLFVRACINMAALHAINSRLYPGADQTIQFKSPDYQKSMTHFREVVGNIEDYEKIRLFLNFEKWPLEKTEEPQPAMHPAFQKNRPQLTPAVKEILPTLKDKLIWI